MRRALLALSLVSCHHAQLSPKPTTNTTTQPALPVASTERLIADVAWLSAPARNGRGSYSIDASNVSTWIADQWRASSLQVTLQEIPNTGGQVNVIGILPGSDNAVVFGAHYDHLGVLDGETYLGADDNASGVSVVLELSRILAVYRGYTLVFIAFGAEEDGLLGSAEYAAHPLFPLEKTRAMLNFDMVGRNFLEVARNKEDAFAIVGAESDPMFEERLRKASRDSHGDAFFVTARLLAMLGFERSSDDYNFRQKDVPTLFFSTSMHHDYHKPSDTVEKIKPSQLQLVTNTVIHFLYSLP